MGCLKLAHISENEPSLRCVWKSSGHSKQGVNWYDYGARFYDPSLGRFPTLDPKAENYSFQSSYVYAGNDPIKFIDKNGENPAIPIIAGLTAIDLALISTGIVTTGVILQKAEDGGFVLNPNLKGTYTSRGNSDDYGENKRNNFENPFEYLPEAIVITLGLTGKVVWDYATSDNDNEREVNDESSDKSPENQQSDCVTIDEGKNIEKGSPQEWKDFLEISFRIWDLKKESEL